MFDWKLGQPLFMAGCPDGTVQCPIACLYLLSFLSVVHPYISAASRGQSHGVTHMGLAKY
jgi:hypothetical protein